MPGLRVTLCKELFNEEFNDTISPIAKSMALDEDPSQRDHDWEALNWTINRLIKKMKKYHPIDWSTCNVYCRCYRKYL